MTQTSEVLTPANPDFLSVVTAAFDPSQKRKPADICKTGVTGSGFIEGKIFERPTLQDGCLSMVLNVELGKRLRVSLFGTILRHCDVLPTAIGTQLRLQIDGLVLEDLEPEYCKSLLTLKKRFVWRHGGVVFARNPKTGEEIFVNTNSVVQNEPPSASQVANVSESTSPSTIPMKRKKTPPPASSPPPSVAGPESGTRVTPETTIQPPSISCPDLDGDAMAVDPPSPPPAESAAAEKQSQPAALSDGLQNPQSLPSPPPEHSLPNDVDQHSRALPGNNPPGESVPEPARPTPNHSPDTVSVGDVVPKKSKKRHLPELKAHKSAKRLKENQARRDKRLRRIIGRSNREGSATADPDELYWEHAEAEIPDELLLEVQDAQALDEEAAQAEEQTTPGASRAASTATESPPEAGPQSTDVLPPTKDENEDPYACLREGCATQFGTYTPLIQFHGLQPRDIMGAVVSPGTVSETKTGESKVQVILIDPSNSCGSGLNVTLFDKSSQSLPRPEVGDVLLLRSIIGDKFNDGAWALGPSFKPWRWAIFHVKTGKVTSTPADTMRHMKLEKSELQYSLRLGDWWRDFSSSEISFADERPSWGAPKSLRKHKLIAEARGGEFIDCTVEILHGFQNNNNVFSVYTLFVTDYTRNEQAPASYGSWCPAQLAPVAFPVELWESSTAVGPTMQPGTFYSIRNMKLKWSAGGCLEGKMQEGHKISKLNEDELENQPRLIELLQRKKEWEEKVAGNISEFPHKLIKEIEPDKFFNCTVEVVAISHKDDFLYIYFTDYTERIDLVPVPPSVTTEMLRDRIVRISVNDAQVEPAKQLEVGDFVSIRNLRLRAASTGTYLSGRLGGDQRLISKLNPNASGNKELQALRRRKRDLEALFSKPKPKPKPGKEAREDRVRRRANGANASTSTSERSTSVPAAQSKDKAASEAQTNPGPYVTLNTVKASEESMAVFRVRARAVDFYPDDMRDCTVLRCTSCDDTIPKTRTRCTKCDDAMEDETSVRAFFRLWFRIVDDEGTTLDVSVSEEGCSVLKDLCPDDVHEDEEAFGMFVARVKPLLGGVLEIIDGEGHRRPLEQDEGAEESPLLDLVIGSYKSEGTSDTPIYVILNHSLCDAAS